MIMLVGFDAPFSILYIKVELTQLLEYLLVDWNSMISHDDSTIQRNVFDLIAPLVIVNLLDPVPFARVYVQDLLKEVLERLTHKVWEDVFSR